MDKITMNQLFKSSKKINVEHLKSTNNWELEITNARNFVSWRTICWMATGKFEKIQLNLRRTQKWTTCCNNVTKQEISVGKNRRLYVTFIQYIQDNPASIYVQIRLFCRKESNEFKQVTYVSYRMEEFKELIENLKDFSNIEQCTFQ